MVYNKQKPRIAKQQDTRLFAPALFIFYIIGRNVSDL